MLGLSYCIYFEKTLELLNFIFFKIQARRIGFSLTQTLLVYFKKIKLLHCNFFMSVFYIVGTSISYSNFWKIYKLFFTIHSHK